MTLHARLAAAAVLAFTGLGSATAQVTCSPETMSLVAGQHEYAGTVSIVNVGANLCVTYQTVADWMIRETHLSVESSLAAIPQTRSGNPRPGQFTYATTHNPPVSTFTYCVPRPAGTIYVAAHAALANGGRRETGWAGDQDFPGANWATYYTVSCDFGPPQPD